MSDYKQHVVDLLTSLETGDPGPASAIDPGKYIQHNLAVADGPAGLAALVASLPKGQTKVRIVRVFQDGDFVFAHTEYDFFGPKIGFDIFRFENGKIVEHWDNLQTTESKPAHTMIDGPTEVSDLEKTGANKELLRNYMNDVFFEGRKEKFPTYYDGNNYIQHNPWIVEDGVTGVLAGLKLLAERGKTVKYDRAHMILGEGNFVLVVAEGSLGGTPTAIYDLYRIENGKIAEHWDTLETIPPREEWKNPNGKF